MILAPPPPPRSCRYNSPCYPGADCRDTPSGPVCLRCPSGYHGDGRNCRRYPTCSDNPCFEGVECTDTPTGYSWVIFFFFFLQHYLNIELLVNPSQSWLGSLWTQTRDSSVVAEPDFFSSSNFLIVFDIGSNFYIYYGQAQLVHQI